eukprot:TRINITY_DN1478_c0_g1_i1.p1 TRINITY_DN1478_c0_g1~~TRINITY_DN1478_c0_g1_i1.p1  ORF type:complete len:177 (+),score=31.59 TRINITY_DN1478_c0_g1_i1:461-991(+)
MYKNTTGLISTEGELVAKYSKIHLFDVDIPGVVRSKESEYMTPGNDVSVTSTPMGNIGFSICYDLRFPELFRNLSERDCQVIVLPSCFSEGTGKVHWKCMVQTRAIENQCYVIAPNQFGMTDVGFAGYGHSLIVDPWGKILAECLEEQGIIYADIDMQKLFKVRTELPALTHRRIK